MAQVKTEPEMFPLVESWLKSGLSQKQFCLEHQMPVHILAYWVGRYRQSQPNKTTADKVVATKAVATKSNVNYGLDRGIIKQPCHTLLTG